VAFSLTPRGVLFDELKEFTADAGTIVLNEKDRDGNLTQCVGEIGSSSVQFRRRKRALLRSFCRSRIGVSPLLL